MSIPARARIVIIGGGIIGTSVAYHLVQAGETDVLLLEQGELSCGTTWHAAGLVGQLRATQAGTALVQYSASLYERLEAEVGLSTGFKRVGGVTVARTPDRMEQLRRTVATAAAYDLECELMTPQQALDRYPLMAVDDLVGAIWLPGDGTANPTDVTQALARGARRGGATIVEHVRVTEVVLQDGRVTGVRTDAGEVEAEIVVNCAGQWAHQLAADVGVAVPLHSAEHFYVVTDQIDGVRPDLPILRDPDGYTYMKEEVGREEAWGCVGVSAPGQPALVLNGHVDVVPAGEPEDWTNEDPWHVREDDGRWYGRGVCDMKGGVVAIIAAARAVSDLDLSRPFAVHTVIGEEDGGVGTFATLLRGHTGDACVIAEPTAGRIITANAGSLTFRLEVGGQATHGSMPHRGHSAIMAFDHVHRALLDLSARRNTAPPAPFDADPWPLSVGTVQAGDWSSTVPDRLVAEGRFGVMPGETFEQAEAVFEQAVAEAAAQHPWLKDNVPTVTWPGGRFAAGRLPVDDPFGDQVSGIVAASGAGAAPFAGAPYGSDLRQYAAAGIPTLQYGPGDVGQAHSVDESVSIDEVVRCAEVYARLIVDRCS